MFFRISYILLFFNWDFIVNFTEKGQWKDSLFTTAKKGILFIRILLENIFIV